MDSWIGAGGWGYFHGPSGNSLLDYAKAFRFVEVNSTFYRHPLHAAVRRWRRSVPADFHFSVKGHRSITHSARFEATARARSSLARDAGVVNALRSDLLVLETPPHLEFGREETAALRDLSAGLEGRMRVGLEARAYAGRPLPAALASALRDAGGFDVVDLSKGEIPRVESDVLYTRLLGKGEHNVWEFSDEELREIDVASSAGGSNRMVFAFHGVRMYKDAARFQEFRSTGSFRAATRGQGTLAVAEVLEPDARFPATRGQLLRDHGWKVVGTADGRNVHAEEFLARLPDKKFLSLAQALRALGVSFGPRVPNQTDDL